MPGELEKDDPSLVQGTSFTMSLNDEMNGMQATETHKIKSGTGHSVGTGGETVGFAKYQVNGLIAPTFQMRDDRSNLVDQLKKLNAPRSEPPSEDEAKEIATQVADLKRQITKLDNDIYGTVLSKATFLNDASSLYKDSLVVEQGEIARDDDLGLLSRSVASSEVGKLLSTGGRSAVAEERFGVDSQGKTIGISVQCEGVGVSSDYGDPKKQAFLDVDYSDPDIQRGLADLQADDFITGQMDRHPGNIFIDPNSKKVTGIDNDLAFPEVSREDLIQRRGVGAFKGTVGLPTQISSEKAAKILSTTPEQLEKTLRDMPRPKDAKPLSPEAIQGAKDRLVQMQEAIKNPKSGVQVIKEFNKKTYDAALKEQANAFNNDPTNKSNNEKFGQIGEKPSGFTFKAYDGCPKTSYLGSVEIARHQKTLSIKAGETDHTYRKGETVSPISREPVVDQAMKEMAQSKQQTLKDPSTLADKKLGTEIAQLQKDMEPLKQENAQLDQKIAKLEKPGMLTRFKEVFTGDKDRMGKITAARDQQQQNLQKMRPMEEQLNQKLDQSVAPIKQEMERKLQEKQGPRVELAQSQGVSSPGVQQSEGVRSSSVGEREDEKEKVDVKQDQPKLERRKSVRESMSMPRESVGVSQEVSLRESTGVKQEEKDPSSMSVKDKVQLFGGKQQPSGTRQGMGV